MMKIARLINKKENIKPRLILEYFKNMISKVIFYDPREQLMGSPLTLIREFLGPSPSAENPESSLVTVGT